MKLTPIKPGEIKIIPTKKKFEKEQKVYNQTIGCSGLPEEMPLERNIYLTTPADAFEQIKNKIQITIENMKR